VPISYRGALLSSLLLVSLIPTSHNRPSTYQLQRSATEHSSTYLIPTSYKRPSVMSYRGAQERYWAPFDMYVSFPEATTGLVLSVTKERRSATDYPSTCKSHSRNHNRPIAHQLHRSATDHFSTNKSHSHSNNRPSTHQLLRSATEHSYTSKSHSHKPQQAYCLSVTEERYWALFYM
jgi:hypothetical protein